ncbi:hypothetical protein C8A05DRAFT_40950 [Staphylotrichum tortipilum]|uniref:HMG box domain-containing protein n=1 Tax=Staphylotrichum tortipilum TaxID=2831512 RepID=A0AAN6RXA5_9PEZI|nr:hypothetical protein C8A05DRAFT_40950 [Staphylotrichum longicolle]
MDRHTPPSPTPTKVEPMPSGFSELLQHNSSTPYPGEAIPTTESIPTHLQPGSRYGTPGLQLPHSQGIEAPMVYQQGGVGGDLQPYHQPAAYAQHSSPYGPVPEPYHTPATSPPTPSRRLEGIASRNSNRRREIGSKALAPRSSRVAKPAPKKKKERAKPAKDMPVLEDPISELTKDSLIPIVDIDTYVHRSSDVRRQEVETGKNPGKIKRPMNAFMLYRKAYQSRAKEWADQYNHQVVSQVCGKSWPLEPEELRQQFKTWAVIERDNHQRAHPNYKFAPSKPQKPPKVEGPADDRSDASELGDLGDEWVSGPGSHHMRSATLTPGADSDYQIPSRGLYAATHPHQHQLAGLHAMGMLHHTRSAAASLDFHSGKTLPAVYDHRELAAQYYDTSMRNPQQRHLHHAAVVDDGLARRTPSPSLAFQPHHTGLHGHYNLGRYHHKVEQQAIQPQQQQQQAPQQHRPQQYQGHHFEHRIDPSLMPHDDALFNTSDFNTIPGMFAGDLGVTQQTWPTTQLAAVDPVAESQYSHVYTGLDQTLSVEETEQFMNRADQWILEAPPETGEFEPPAGWPAVVPKVEH